MTDRELLEIIATQVGKLTTQVEANTLQIGSLSKQVGGLAQDLNEVKADLAEVKVDLKNVKTIVIKIENEHGQKLGVLLNGYEQNAERLDRVEAKLVEHDEILLKRF